MSYSPYLDTNGNFSFIPSNSNINDISLIYIPWSNITFKPNFSQVSTSANYLDLLNLPDLSIFISSNQFIISSNDLFNYLTSNIISSSNNSIDYTNLKFIQENNLKWSYDNSNVYLTNNNFNVGIGTTNTSYKFDVLGSINTSSNYFII